MERTCRYCGITKEYINHQHYASHCGCCSANPNVIEGRKQSGIKLTKPKKEYWFTCPTCNKKFSCILTLHKFKNKRYNTYCSRKCANFFKSKETRRRIGKSNSGRKSNKKDKTFEEMYGLEKSLELRNGISKSSKGRIKTPEECLHHSMVLTGRKNGPPSEKTRQKMIKSHLGQIPKHKKRVPYNGVNYRSTWEVITVKFFEQNEIEWQYEPKRFWFEEFTYLPDFYLPKIDLWVEVKGWMNERSKNQIDKFKELGKNIVIFQENEINSIKKQLN